MKASEKTFIKRFNNEEPIALNDAIQCEAFQDFIENPSPNREVTVENLCLYLPALLNGEKPGLTTSFECESIQDVNKHSEKFLELNLSHKILFDKRYGTAVFHVSSDNEILEQVEPSVEDEIFGTFLGVPEQDNMWYKETGGRESITEYVPITDHVSYSPVDIKYARLVSWVCKPTVEGIDRTVSIGKNWYEIAEKLDSKGFRNPIKWARKKFRRENHCWYP